MSKLISGNKIYTFCAQCGDNVQGDEDGCCASCGCTIIGDGVDSLSEYLTTAQARIAELEGELMMEREVCICGCDNSDHEFLGPDDGECCGNEDHQCLRVAPGIRAMFIEQRDRAETLQAQVERLTEALERIRDRALIGTRKNSHHTHIYNIALAALTPDRKGG